ncbi:DUF4167 domain-containing protein [Candidatus Liberibacter asiaticus]|uniref:DUF4167 domain-containing protein n=2 Tax=Liberibacter asiaticus TaxID=34021 RepID=C6XG46_LIBAP|nr:DUF4167 domain-containing protein [Candidatus Liberibacter asiaticus]ACT57349.1 hypothetical protein CLIBASIA_03865 [Candidatus Liberibacter asiaticus str. psy62]AGH17113.1 hypothetical protein WSI_03715 [Candidatus Liberibacter asiaticus str. gxpsy]ALK07428.1 DUF4167 domain-containing protein [Candidatus Liberibacter asiaticus]ASK52919.1 hypothetical protein B2I23_03830 [Candidatus Liberibacter asiaticus]AWL14240.1 DUF4167 domain-containing protein [Candidatus Liberibacter asiaticus]
MRSVQQYKRSRGRGSNGGNGSFNRKNLNPLVRNYDSNGYDVKVRGTAQHIAERYSVLARDAMSAGDYVVAENHLQHAEHYNRIVSMAQAQIQEKLQRDEQDDLLVKEQKERAQNALSEFEASPCPLIEEGKEPIFENSIQPKVEDVAFKTPDISREKDVSYKKVRRRRPLRPRVFPNAKSGNQPVEATETIVPQELNSDNASSVDQDCKV